MYKVYHTNYIPFWINSENKPSYNFFQTINFNWEEINLSPNFIYEFELNIVVEDTKNIYFKLVRLNDIDQSVIETLYFHFDSIKKRMNKGFLISCKLDIWTSYNMLLENKFKTENTLIKVERASLPLKKYVQFPIAVDSLTEVVNEWRAKNEPIVSSWRNCLLDNKNGEFKKWNNGKFEITKFKQTDNVLVSNLFTKELRNIIVNKYLVIYYENEYYLFPDLSVKYFKETEKDNNDFIIHYPNNTGKNEEAEDKETPTLIDFNGWINKKGTQDYEWMFIYKFNRSTDLEYLINQSKIFSAKKEIGYYYCLDLEILIKKFKLQWGFIQENKRMFFYLKLPFYGTIGKSIFTVQNNSTKIISLNSKNPTFYSDSEREIIIGNTHLKFKQLINNDYLLLFDYTGFKLIPTNQTNNELFFPITFGDMLPTNKDQYLEYVNSVRNSVNTGFYSAFADKSLNTAFKFGKALLNPPTSVKQLLNQSWDLAGGVVDMVASTSVNIAKLRAKFRDLKNSLGVVPQTSNIQDLIYYQIPNNWLEYNKQSFTEGEIVTFQYSLFNWLETSLLDLNNLFVYYGYELNNTYNYQDISNFDNYYFIKITPEWLSANEYIYFSKNIDINVKRMCLEQWINGIRIFNNDNKQLVINMEGK